MDFKTRLKELREIKGLTQKQLADKLNSMSKSNKIYPQNISYWENGREPNLSIIIDLANLFNVTTDYLLGNTDNLDFNEVSYEENFNTVLNKKVLDTLIEDLPDIAKSEFYKMFNNHIDILNLNDYILAKRPLSIDDLEYIRLITRLDKLLLIFKGRILTTLISIDTMQNKERPLLKELNFNRISELNTGFAEIFARFSIILSEFCNFVLNEVEKNGFKKLP